MAVQQNNYGTGRRKSAVARVFLKPGDELRLTVSGLGEQRVKIVAER